jgi:hypothetical protein
MNPFFGGLFCFAVGEWFIRRVCEKEIFDEKKFSF